jgi:uncharacterized protein (TIGR02271 family)
VAIRRKPIVVDEAGIPGHIREFVVDEAGTAAVTIELKNGQRLTLPAELLRHHDNGGYGVQARWTQFTSSHALDLPVVAEEVTVAVRTVDRERLRIRRQVVTDQQTIETPLIEEHILVERIPCDTFVDRMPEARREGDTLIVPCVEEVAVVEKRLRVREEVRIRVVREQRIDRRTVPVRRHDIQIERESGTDPDSLTSSANPKKTPGGTS